MGTVSAGLGALVAMSLWPAYANFIGTSGLPYSDVLERGMPAAALIGGVGTTLTISVIAGLRSSRKIVRSNLIEGAQFATAFHAKSISLIARGVALAVGIALLVGVGAIYGAIGRGKRITDPRAMGDF